MVGTVFTYPPRPQPDAEGKVKYYGNCHCGAFKFALKMHPLKEKGEGGEARAGDTQGETTTVVACNCSICGKKGALWVFPSEGDLTVEKGSIDKTLTAYERGPKTTKHRFCPTCGSAVMADRHGAPQGSGAPINVRMIRDLPFPLSSLVISKFDAFGLPPKYVFPAFPNPPQLTAEEKGAGLRLYNGSCHCGAVRICVKSEPLESGAVDVKQDDCSICTRQALLNIYPRNTPASTAVFLHLLPHHDRDADPSLRSHAEQQQQQQQQQQSPAPAPSPPAPGPLRTYAFGPRMSQHRFCGVCGVQVDMLTVGPPAAAVARLPPARREFVRAQLQLRPVNVRALDCWLEGGSVADAGAEAAKGSWIARLMAVVQTSEGAGDAEGYVVE